MGDLDFRLVGLALLAASLAAALAWAWLSGRQRERRLREDARTRETRLATTLSTTGERYWEYTLATDTLRRVRAAIADGDAPARTDEDLATMRELVHPHDATQVRDRLVVYLRGENTTFTSEHRIRDAEGQWTWVRARGHAVERDADGRVLRMAGTVREIGRERRTDRERRIAMEVLRSMKEAVAVLDTNFDFVSVNPAFGLTTGYDEAEVLGRNANILDSTQHDHAFYEQVRERLRADSRWSGEMWQQRKDGEEFLASIETTTIFDLDGRHALYVTVLDDITHQKRAEQELRYLANFDTLTNLPNRALLSERLSRAIVRARREGTRLAVLFLDLDRFKDINDSLGHAAGDRILRAAARRLQQTVGRQHTVARLGGDEFTVVLEGLSVADDADKVAREVIMAFEAPLELDERQEVSITPSIGVSVYPDHAQIPTELLKHADTAMYQAKGAGRRTFMRYHEDMDVAIRRRATISGALRKVLERGELRLVYQPRLGLSPMRITGVEALLRWNSAEHGVVHPVEFIPLAEESGLIMEMGEWALREACLTLQRWRQHGLVDLSMAVNVSMLQLLRGDFAKVVRQLLEDTGVPPKRLELELTESVLMANAEQSATRFQAFRAMGVSLAIDDFGTGYSSLAYLKRLPITTLKIDKTFVGDLGMDPDDEAIATTIITMAHSLELCVVAEGVETDAQARFLRQHGCDEIQGYWLAPPMDAHRCLAFIRNWSPRAMPADPAGHVAPARS